MQQVQEKGRRRNPAGMVERRGFDHHCLASEADGEGDTLVLVGYSTRPVSSGSSDALSKGLNKQREDLRRSFIGRMRAS